MLCNALVSVPQHSSVMLILVTDISNCVRGILRCLNWQHRVCSLSLMSSNAPQNTNTASNIVCCQLCSCSLLCSSCCGLFDPATHPWLATDSRPVDMMLRHLFQRCDLCSLPPATTVCVLVFLDSTVCCPQHDLQVLLQQTLRSKRSQIVLGNVLLYPRRILCKVVHACVRSTLDS